MKALHAGNNEQGFIKFILVTAILFSLVYAGIQFGIPYYKHSAFRSDVKELARISLGDVDKTRTQIFERAQELKLPLEAKDIVVTKTDKTVRVRTSWEETVDLMGFYQKTLTFSVDVEE
jgi:Flp pilus assembly protein TadG